jgi:hypothetical protein
MHLIICLMIGNYGGIKMEKRYYGKVIWTDTGQTKVAVGELRFSDAGFVTVVTESGKEIEINRMSIIAISKNQIEGFKGE